ncbi:polyketide synthase [Metarhizium rileyi]|uniref:Polyketide synthase n=1 Tax=Metarhizium rileyi (strain RCEF 4871) TaxID=1649241 RepID=A0A166WZZ4_METRR|nr:polyketide synthase [Metarhizium rileyi RCEF 4871]
MMTTTDVVQKEPELLAFGDLAASVCLDSLQPLLHAKNNAELADFFARVSSSLRRYFGQLPSSQRILFPRFSTLIDLAAKWEGSPGRSALQPLLLSVLQSAHFIRHYGGPESAQYPSTTNTAIISSCAGSFTAAAVSCSHSMSSFVPLAVEAALAAFRTGLKSYLVGEAIVSGRHDASTAWSVSVSPTTDVTIEALLSTLAESPAVGCSSDLPEGHRTVWVTAKSPSGAVSLGGRPLALSNFIAANKDKLRAKWLNITSPYHAPHLFSVQDIDEIMRQVSASAAMSAVSRIALLLPQRRLDTNTNFMARLRMAISGTLREQLDLDATFESCGVLLGQMGSRSCHLTSVAYGTTSMLSAALSNNFGIHLEVEEVFRAKDDGDQATGRLDQSKIAIVGYAGRYPSADSTEAFWELLRAGRDVHREIPKDRFIWEAHYDEEGKETNKCRVKHGCFLESPGLFDARFFNMSPREAENTDPAQRLAILTTYEALEMAGFVRNRTPSTQDNRVGVFFGATSDDWREVNASQDVDTYLIPGGNRAFCPGRISYFFRLSGPSISIDTACSSSLSAIQVACSSLSSGQCDTAIAGGCNILTSPYIFCGLDRAHFLSTRGNCNVFDNEADGYCRADAVGSVILKRLEDAIADNDPIQGVIVGFDTNHCGQAESITRPHEGDQAALFQQILQRANYSPLDISVVEMHGTGTQAGDATEMNSVLSSFVPGRERTEAQPNRPLYIGSLKANVGHSEAASGVTALIKTLLMLKHNEIPPHCGIKTEINRSYPSDLAERGVRIASQPTPWPRYLDSTKRAVFINNFSAAGGNTAILMEEAPRRLEITQNIVDRQIHLIAITAKTAKSLVQNAQSLVSWLQRNPNTVLSELSYTTTARRVHHDYRIMLPVESMSSLLKELKSLSIQAPQSFQAIPRPGKLPRIVFTFTGQGCLYAGMGRELFEVYRSFREDILQLNQLAESYGFPSFVGLRDGSINGDIHGISVVVSHLAHLCIQIALVRLLGRWRIKPSAVIGHSLGEYAALYAASVISAGDAIFLVGSRATLFGQLCRKGTHGMLIVKASRRATEYLLHKNADFEVACANHPTAHVVAGPKDQMPALIVEASRSGLATVELDVPFAFHSVQVEPILSAFEMAGAEAGIFFSAPTIPFISPLLGRVVSEGEEDILNMSYLAQASRRLVDFSTALTMAQIHGLSGTGAIWLEIGVHPLCKTMIQTTLGHEEKVLSTLKESMGGCQTMAKSVETLYLAGMDIDWNEYHREFPAGHRVLELPCYSWDLKNYWIDYKERPCCGQSCLMRKSGTMEPKAEAKVYKYISPAAQKVIEEVHKESESTMVVESDIFHQGLLPLLQGHVVNGVLLCPSSLYAEIGLTMGDYLLQARDLCREKTGLEIYDLHFDQPLIAKAGETAQNFRVSVKADWTLNMLNLSVFSVDGFGKQNCSHAVMSIRIVPHQHWLADWKRNAHLVMSRVRALESSDNSQKLRRRMVYKLFASLVNYDEAFQGMSEVLLDTDDLEAVSTVQFQVDASQSGFGVDTRWIDSLGQISGFIMNANDATNSQEQVFINHGWETLRYAERLTKSKTYRAYCRMQLAEKTTFVGDVFVLDADRIVAIYQGVKFIGMRRQALNHLLPAQSMASDQKTAAAAAAAGDIQYKPGAPSSGNNNTTSYLCGSIPPIVSKAPRAVPGFGPVVKIICEEIGIPSGDLDLESPIAELGIDSLLSLSITSRIRQELGLEISSTALLRCELIGELQQLMSCEGSFVGSSTDLDECSNDGEETSTQESITSFPDEEDSTESSHDEGIRHSLWATIASETATPIGELSPSLSTTDVGIDSLLAIEIAANLGAEFSVNITSTLIMSCETLLDIEVALRKVLGVVKSSGPTAAKETRSPSHGGNGTLGLARKCTSYAKPQGSMLSRDSSAATVLLSGSVSTAKSVLILFPDGSGSAASYANLAPNIHKQVAVYGVNCPWRKKGLELIRLKVTVSQIVAKQLVEVRRIIESHRQQCQQCRQSSEARMPEIMLGGWSAGGILAYEAIRQLAIEGVVVSKLLLLDSPDPFGLQIPTRKMSCFLEGVLRFGGRTGKAPDWLLPHFDGMVEVLGSYTPLPLTNNAQLATLLVYAPRGASNDYHDPDSTLEAVQNRDIRWILKDRTDFTASGWRSLLGSRKTSIEILDGADHFSMMEEAQQVGRLGGLISDVLP